jgi:microcystin-dependent protein
MYVGEIRIFAHGTMPSTCHACDGALLHVADYPALAALLGTTYGGDGFEFFGLPNLLDRTVVGSGVSYSLGQTGGEAEVTLTLDQMPEHSHTLRCDNASASQSRPANHYPGKGSTNQYEASSTADMASDVVTAAGGGESHQNMPPFAALVYCIVLTGDSP